MSLSECLIELVREKEVLYNREHQDYLKKTLKDTIWDGIAKELNLKNGSEAKKEWLKLRNCHRDALRRKSTKSGSAAQNARQWKYEKQMMFLVDYMTNSKTTGNLAEENKIIQEETVITEYESETEDSSTEPELNESSGELLIRRSQKGKKCKTAAVNQFLKVVQQHEERLTERHQRRHNIGQEDDELYHFFMSVYHSAKKMPKLNQLKIKREIFNAVSEEEELLCAAPSTAQKSLR